MMDVIMKGILKMINLKEKEFINLLMESSMMENGQMIILTEKENNNLLMDHIMKGILKIVKEMDWVL